MRGMRIVLAIVACSLLGCKAAQPVISVRGGLRELARFNVKDFVLPAAVVPSYPLISKSIIPEQEIPVYEYGDKTIVIAGGAVNIISNEARASRLPNEFPGDYRLSYLEGDSLTVVSRKFGSTHFTQYDLRTGTVISRKFSVPCDGGARFRKMTVVWGGVTAYLIEDEKTLDPPTGVLLFDAGVCYGTGANDRFFLTLKSGNVMDVWGYGLNPLRNLWKSVGGLLGVTDGGVLILKDWQSEVWLQNPANGDPVRTIRLVGFDGRFVAFRDPYLFYSCTGTERVPPKFQIDKGGGKMLSEGTSKVAGFSMLDINSGASWFVEYYGDSIVPGRSVIGAKSEGGILKLVQVPSFTVLAEITPGGVSAYSCGNKLVVLFERGSADYTIIVYEILGGD